MMRYLEFIVKLVFFFSGLKVFRTWAKVNKSKDLFSGLRVIDEHMKRVNFGSHVHTTVGISKAIEFCRPPCQSSQLQKLSQGRVGQM